MSMAVRQRANGRWFVDIRYNHDRIRMNSPENSKKGAQAYEALLRSNLAKGLPILPETVEKKKTFYEFAEYWFVMHVQATNKSTTIRAKRMTLDRHLYPFLKQKKLDEISSRDIEEIKSIKLREALSPKTVNNILSALRACLNCAVEWGEVDRLPKIKMLKVAEQPFRFLSEDECRQLLLGAKSVIDRDMVLCAMRTGMRRGELLGLEWRSVDFNLNQITIQQSYVEGELVSTKNNRIRHVPMVSGLHNVLAQRRQNNGFVFSETGYPVREIRASKWLKRVCERSGIKPLGWHVLRHTFASHLVQKNVPIRAVQMLLGHSSIQMTERYSHLAQSFLEGAINVLEEPNPGESENFGQHLGTETECMRIPQSRYAPKLR